MAAFRYQAVDPAGRSTRGVIEAANPAGARRLLRDRGLLPTAIEAGNAPAGPEGAALGVTGPGGTGLVRLRRRSVSSQALATATRQLATLIGSDMRIEDSLRLIAAQGSGPLHAVLLDVRSAILEGGSFARALRQHPRVFPEFYCASIHAGEQSGKLAQVLEYLADSVERRERARQKLRLALLYPALLAITSGLIMSLMMIYVVPDITRVFLSRGADLPLLTRIVIAVSQALSAYGLVLLVVLLVLAVIAGRQFAVPANRLAFDRMLATRWPFAHFVQQTNGARFATTLATLVHSAVPLLDGLTASAAVIANRHIRAQAEAMARRVREGESFHRAIAEAEGFPTMLVAIVASGEASRRLGPALSRAANELEREVDAQVAVVVSLVEPAVLLLMGGLVLLMVLAILLPIIGLNDLAIS